MKAFAILYGVVAAIFLFFIIHITADKKASAVFHPVSVHEGYAPVPASYDVTASPNYIWHHGGHNNIMIVVGFGVLLAAGFIGYVMEEGKKEIKSAPKIVILLAAALFGVGLIFGKYLSKSTKPGSSLYKSINQAQYDAAKNNLDSIFELK
jgi:preprotein translocase subunit Sec61beta